MTPPVDARPTSEVLAIIKRRGVTSWWMILDCGHWYKWTGAKRPSAEPFPCPECAPMPSVEVTSV